MLHFENRKFLVLGCGSIAQAFLPMFMQTIAVEPEQVLVVSSDATPSPILSELGLEHSCLSLTPESYVDQLDELVGEGDCVVNLTGGVSARALVDYCFSAGIDYIDTSNERWEFGSAYDDAADFAKQWELMISARESAGTQSTALVSHGANPGLVSHFAKQAVLNLAESEGVAFGDKIDWSDLAQQLKIRAFHISEEDTQTAPDMNDDVLRNTWCIGGLLEECHSAPCFAWGSLEADAGDLLRIRRDRTYDVAHGVAPAKDCQMTSWLPSVGEFEARITPHEEAFSIAELFTSGGGKKRYQPSVLFAYRPCEEARLALLFDEDVAMAMDARVMNEEILEGQDELGVLVLREDTEEVYWFGSTLDIQTARSLMPHTNATSMQVAAGVLGGVVWLLENPNQGLVSAEYCDHHRVLEVARPWLGNLEGHFGVWDKATHSTVSLLRNVASSTESREGLNTPLPERENRL